jgi:hypothetical protein
MENKLTIVEALNEIMKAVGGIAKKDRNQAQGFNFRGIDSVVNAVSPALQKFGVVVFPTVEDCSYETVEIGRNRTAMGHVRVRVSYTFIGAGGDSLKTTVVGEAMDSGDKATAKAMSVAFRTALLQALCLPTDDIDPDATSYERSSVADVLAPSAILIKINQSTNIQDLAEVGDYIVKNRDGYSPELVNQFREKFKEQQTKLTPAKLEEDTNDTNRVERSCRLILNFLTRGLQDLVGRTLQRLGREAQTGQVSTALRQAQALTSSCQSSQQDVRDDSEPNYRETTGLHHGSASGVLSVLHKAGRIARLKETTEWL